LDAPFGVPDGFAVADENHFSLHWFRYLIQVG
jgi:hypothetical protein